MKAVVRETHSLRMRIVPALADLGRETKLERGSPGRSSPQPSRWNQRMRFCAVRNMVASPNGRASAFRADVSVSAM